jgi:hypothetical protein
MYPLCEHPCRLSTEVRRLRFRVLVDALTRTVGSDGGHSSRVSQLVDYKDDGFHTNQVSLLYIYQKGPVPLTQIEGTRPAARSGT